MYADVTAGDPAALPNLLSLTEDVVVIGTDPDEFWVGGPECKAISLHQYNEILMMGPVKFEQGTHLRAYVEGNIGWVVDNPTLLLGNGLTIEGRLSIVFRREEEGWRIIHFHSSVGAANQEVWGGEFTTAIDAVAEAVERLRPDLSPIASPDGTVTILFTDIEASTALNESLGDRQWHTVLKGHIDLVDRVTRVNNGEVVDRAGDGFMLAFSSASRGLRCAVELQRELISVGTDHPIRMRIGVHTGEPIRDSAAFFGRDVAYAARVAACANGGEILASAVVRELCRGTDEFTFASPRDHEFKGFEGTQSIHPVTWAPSNRPT